MVLTTVITQAVLMVTGAAGLFLLACIVLNDKRSRRPLRNETEFSFDAPRIASGVIIDHPDDRRIGRYNITVVNPLNRFERERLIKTKERTTVERNMLANLTNPE